MPKKVFLIRAYGLGERIPYGLPYGLLYIKSFLRKSGIDSYIFDRELNQSLDLLQRALLNYNPYVIGISAMTIQSSDVKFIIKKIREWMGEKIIIVGGTHFTAQPNKGLEYGADYVITGEGEISLL